MFRTIEKLCVTAQMLEASTRPDTEWVPVPEMDSAACDVTLPDGQRCVVVASFERHTRDTARTAQLVEHTEEKLLALEERVRQGRLKDPAKIGRAAQRILGASGVSRLFEVEIGTGRFLYHYGEDALDYEQQLLAGRYVLTTSLTPDQATPVDVVGHYRRLTRIENRFRVLKDFLHLRPVYHWTEKRVRGHIGIYVIASVIEALISRHLSQAGIADPDIEDQTLSCGRALRELRPDPLADSHRRRPHHQPRHPPQRPPTTHPRRPRRRHHRLEQGPNHLTQRLPESGNVVTNISAAPT